MKYYKLTKKGINLMKKGHKDIRTRFLNGEPAMLIAKDYSLPLEWICRAAITRSWKKVPIMDEWMYNYCTSLLKNGVTKEELCVLFPNENNSITPDYFNEYEKNIDNSYERYCQIVGEHNF